MILPIAISILKEYEVYLLWRVFIAFMSISSLLVALLRINAPETPYFLYRANRNEELLLYLSKVLDENEILDISEELLSPRKTYFEKNNNLFCANK